MALQQNKNSLQDTAGEERFRTLSPSYYRNAQGAILVYDVTKEETFKRLEKWLAEIDTYCYKEDIVKMVVGNKIDLPDRKISIQEGLDFARKHQTLYIESSAKSADGINYAFEDLVQKVKLFFFNLVDRELNCIVTVDNTNTGPLGSEHNPTL